MKLKKRFTEARMELTLAKENQHILASTNQKYSQKSDLDCLEVWKDFIGKITRADS